MTQRTFGLGLTFTFALVAFLIAYLAAPYLIHVKDGFFFTKDSAHHLRSAEYLLSSGFDYFGLISWRSAEGYLAIRFIVGYITLLAFFSAILGPYYFIGVVGTAFVVMALGACLVGRVLAREFEMRILALLLPAAVAASVNQAFHLRAVLSDGIFSGLVLCLLFAGLGILRQPRPSRIALFVLGAVALVFFRGTGPGLVIPTAAILILAFLPDNFFRGWRLAILLGLALAGLLMAILIISTVVFQTKFLPYPITGVIAKRVAEMETPTNILELALVMLARLTHYYRIWVDDFSLAHNLYRSFYYGCAYAGLLVGAILSLQGRATPMQVRMFLAGLSFCLGLPMMHIIVEMDWLNRFFSHAEPVVIFSATCGWAMAWKDYVARRSSRENSHEPIGVKS